MTLLMTDESQSIIVRREGALQTRNETSADNHAALVYLVRVCKLNSVSHQRRC